MCILVKFCSAFLLLPILMQILRKECNGKSWKKSLSPNSIFKSDSIHRLNEQERVSDPHIWNEIENWNHPFSNITLPPGIPDKIETDVPGLPLSPADFHRGKILVFNPIDMTIESDPIEFAGLYEGDIDTESMNSIDLPKDFPPSMHDSTQGVSQRMQPIISEERSAIRDLGRRWPNGVIPYLLSNKYNEQERAVIARAITQFQENTCINFVPRIGEEDYIHLFKGDGCSSSVGKVGGAQKLSLGPGCVHVGIVLHEFMHALGFWHEQSRRDREQFIQIIWSNIQNGMKYNFQKYDNKIIQSLGGYDTNSVMHYGPYAFAKDRTRPTIIAKNGGEIGQRRGFSKIDVLKVRELYKCTNESFATDTPVTTHSPNLCEDSHKFCAVWAKSGECQDNSIWMNVFCTKSCKQCDVKCKDHSPFCEYWSKKNECEKNPMYMLHFCKKSCKVCPLVAEYANDIMCEDTNAYCTAWANSGQCHINPTYMMKYCRRSCNECM